MAKAHWTSRYDMQIAPQTLAARAKGMLQRSGMMNDVEIVSERTIRVGVPDGFDDVVDPLGNARDAFRSDKIDAVARVLRRDYEMKPCRDGRESVIVTFLSDS